MHGFDMLLPTEPWMEESKCAYDTAFQEWQRENRNDQFFDDSPNEDGSMRSTEKRERAKNYCADCPVFSECLEYAIAHPELGGIWAGTTGRDRKKMRNDRQKARESARRAVLEFLKQRQVQLPDDLFPTAS